MNKKANTLLFILGATVFNILVTVAGFLILWLLYVQVLSLLPIGAKALEAAASWAFPFSFLGAIIVSFIVYRFLLKKIIKKFDMEKHFAPILGQKRS